MYFSYNVRYNQFSQKASREVIYQRGNIVFTKCKYNKGSIDRKDKFIFIV